MPDGPDLVGLLARGELMGLGSGFRSRLAERKLTTTVCDPAQRHLQIGGTWTRFMPAASRQALMLSRSSTATFTANCCLAALFLVRALSMGHVKRGRGWVNKHLRVVAGSTGPLSADVEHRPGAMSVSVGLEPHLDHLGHQQYEEVTAQ